MNEQMSETEAKEIAKERDDYRCQFCGLTQEQHKEEYGRGLHAHHIIKDNDGGKDHPRNFITVCRECHTTLENTQADAISQLRENILDTVKDIVKEETRGDIGITVKKGHSYYHKDEGVVSVIDFENYTVSADKDGVNESVIIVYRRRDDPNPVNLKQPIGTFQKKARYESKYGSRVEEKMKQHGIHE